MSRTYRNIPKNYLMRKPKTKNQVTGNIAAKEELKDEGYTVPNGLNRRANPAVVISAWDDQVISGYFEDYRISHQA